MLKESSFILSFAEIDKADLRQIGVKGVALAELTQAGCPVPKGFILCSNAYFSFIRENKLDLPIKNLLSTAHFERPDSLTQIYSHIKKLILKAGLAEELIKEILYAYQRLGGIFHDALVDVYSSPTAEKEFRTHPIKPEIIGSAVKGEANLILKIKETWASLFTPEVLFHQRQKNILDHQNSIAVIIQKTINSESSGMTFTIDPVTNDNTKIIIEAVYGQIKMLKTGKIIPDRYEINKKDFSLLNKNISSQKILLKRAGPVTKEIKINSFIDNKQKITQNKILELAVLGKKLEKYYYFPQEIEWTIEKNKIYIIKTRNITTMRRKETEDVNPSAKLQLLLKGSPGSYGITTGPVKIIHHSKDIYDVKPGDILVSNQTNRDYLFGIKKAAAVITDHGGRASHAAITSRDLGIPAVVGTTGATHVLKDGMIITVNGATGEIYKGALSRGEHFRTATRIYANLDQPGLAARIAQKDIDGIGLFRAETILADIGIHPKKLLKEGKENIYINRLSQQISTICKEFAPRPVIYRASDFKTTEYIKLSAGADFESTESNPLLGYHGAFRHIHDSEAFKLEIEAVKNVRQEVGCKNLWMMIPFCRTIKELDEIKRIIILSGLHRSSTFKLWMSAETASNVILLDKFIEAGIDGVSIGLDNLTMNLLGIDRDNNYMSHAFDSKDAAVLWALEKIIKTCHKYNIPSSIYGNTSSFSSDLIKTLVEWGISSISVEPEIIEKIREKIFNIEKNLIKNKHYGKN